MRGAQMQSNLSIDSTLSTNDSILSEPSISSLEYEARLSNARIGGSDGEGGKGMDGASSSAAVDREMTEDEVAIMVRNALRKARRAMNNCSPVTSIAAADYAEVGGGGGVDGSFDAIPDGFDFGSMSIETASTRDSTGHGSGFGSETGGGGKSDLARRIEEEIQSARNHAQRRYFGSDAVGGEGSEAAAAARGQSSPAQASPPLKGGRVGVDMGEPISRLNRSGQSTDLLVTPLITNVNKNATAGGGGGGEDAYDIVTPMKEINSSSSSSPSSSSRHDSARERIARSRDRIAAANERLSRKEIVNSTMEKSASPVPFPGGHPIAMSPGADDHASSAAKGGGRDKFIPADPSMTGEGGTDVVAIFGDDHVYAPPLGDDGINNHDGDPIKSPVATVHIPHSSNKPPLSESPAPPPPPPGPPPQNTNNLTNKPRHHRQVLFRHPYPLPPPPPLPRGDDLIISTHCAIEKEVHVRWVSPDADLGALIEAAGEEENLIRKSNACGAIKVLASKESNQPKLCRTVGLLDVLVRACWDDAVDSDALDARTRAVTTMLYLAEPKDNRLIVARHAQALDALVKTIEEDTGEARWRASSTLATLAKTPGNRVLMGRSERLVTVLGDLMVEGALQQVAKVGKENEKKGHEIDNNAMAEENPNEASFENHVNNDSSQLTGRDSSTRGGSFDTMDDSRMLTNTYSGTGTFTDASGTTHTDDGTYASVYDSDFDGGESEDDLGSHASRDSYDEGSVEEEEGVEIQISSLKKQNIENASDFLAKSQMSACATLLHLSKNCANAPIMCKNTQLIDSIVTLGGIIENPLHTRCIEILCNFSRFPSNNNRLASNPKCVDMLLNCGKSKIAEDRMWAMRTIQNMCSDASSKVTLATGPMLSVLSMAAMRKDCEEQLAAVGALMNLSTEPGSIVPLTNTKTVVATLVHLAHSPNTPSAVRKIACDSLATIGLWLQTLASAGTVPDEIPFSPLPTHAAMGWLRWDNA
ncbi:hypothetical protein ACHAXA_006946 [Cyclostephanos tholiformis]|uniref:Uncharacterized protein n=1 Tax=Cyclostephanos tholiformis TaxID=382380 RepID=A0ABD3R5U5_9STRA